MVGKRLVNTGGAAGAAGLDPLQNFETVTYTGNGGTQKITGYIRKGAAFNGSSSKILIGEFAGLNTSDYSVSLWFNHDSSDTSTNNRRLIQLNCSSGGDAGLFDMMFKQSTYEFTIRSGSASTNILTYTSNATELPDDTWNHIAVTRDNTTNLTTLYINGTNVKEQTQAEGSTFGSFSSIGCRTNGDLQVLGKIDQVRIFNTELDSTKVGQLAAEDYSDPKKSTTDYFGDGHGVALYELDDDASDTGDNYDGTPTNVNFLGMAFQPDWVWIKDRSADYQHQAYDSVRGATQKILPSSNIAESTDSTGLTAFDSNGFTISTNVGINTNNNDYVAWCWKAGGAASTYNIDGTGHGTLGAAGLSITGVNGNSPTFTGCSINTEAGFGIYEIDPNFTASNHRADFTHGLNSTPQLIFVKVVDGTGGNWWAFTNAIDGSWDRGKLHTTEAFQDDTLTGADVATSTLIRVEDAFISTANRVLFYAFASVDGYQKVGSYSGTGTTSSFTGFGFQPRWIMIRSAASGNWWIFDNVRGNNKGIRANLSNQEDTTDADANTNEYRINFLPDGFQYEIDDSTGVSPDLNTLDQTYIYLAIA
jgi:hypothetical protein